MSDDKPFYNPFAALERLVGARAGASAAPPVAPPSAKTAKPARTYARAVVRMERSGRGGKEVTVIEQLDLSPVERDVWLKSLKAALGCGGKIESDTIMLQGDHRERLKGLLSARGVKRVVIG